MSARILFLSSRYFYQLTVNALDRIRPDCETKVVCYDRIEQICAVYDQYAEECDAVFITGTSARHVLEQHCPNWQKPLVAYQVDSDALHRYILRMTIEMENLDFSRIAMDFMVPLEYGFSVVDFLKLDDMTMLIRQNAVLTEGARLRGSENMEQLILKRIVQLWQQGAIDMVLCLYPSVVPLLQERGIPFRCPFISDGHLKRLIQDALVKIELNRLHDNHPAILQIFPYHMDDSVGKQLWQISACLKRYVEDNLIDGILQDTKDCCILISTMKIIRFLTNDFQFCRLASYFEEKLGFPVAVGYGVGTTISHAMNNVQIASKEAKILGKSFVVDSNGNLIGPLNSEKWMVISSQQLPDVSQIAKRCGLSAMTIQKLASIVRNTGTDKITTQELAQWLNTTIRNANRIILSLCKGGAARPVYTQTSHSRGRPIQVYLLDFGANLT